MLEFIKNCAIDWVLFSFWEGIFFYLFARNNGIKKIKIYQFIVFTFINCLISIIFIPILKQIIAILFMAIYYYIFNKNDINKLQCLKTSFIGMSILFIIEVLYSILLEKILNIITLSFDILFFNKIIIFIYLIPIRMVEYILAIKYKKIGGMIMKLGIGGVVRK